MSPLEQAIREHAWAYVHGELSRDAFMDWFSPVLMDDGVTTDPIAWDLANDVAQYDAELTSGAGTEANLKESIRQRLHVYSGFTPPLQPEVATVATGSDNLSTPDALSSISAAR